MKKILSVFALAFCVSAASMAFAAVQEFGPEFARFTIDVPSGWTARNMDGGAQLINVTQDTSLAVVVAQTTHTDAKVLADTLAKESGYTDPSFEKQDDNTWLITGLVDGTAAATVVGLDEGKMLVITMAGKDMAAVNRIVETLADK